MKKIVVSMIFIIIAAMISNVFAQRETPAGAGDKNLGADDLKTRSIEIDRIKQEALKSDAANFAPINTEINAKFPQIKEDYEGIQISEAAIIQAYTRGKTIDYSLIGTSADSINRNAKRLDTNLFAASKTEKNLEKTLKKEEKPKKIRDIIIELDKAIGDFISSKIFGNIKLIEAEVAIKTRTDLQRVMQLSEELSNEAKKNAVKPE